MTPREAFYRECRLVRLEEAVGEICAETLCPYPPGVPLLAPGEVITRETVEMIMELEGLGNRLAGPVRPGTKPGGGSCLV